ncbi:MAG: murein biosynthesis integral membrane protein MurJ [Paracoccaceae bacterium]
MNRKIHLLSSFFTVGGWTLISRVLGFGRDIMIAAFLGSGPIAEAFLIAFSLPNMFRRFFGEGAFNVAFIPMFAKKVESGEDAKAFAQDAMSGLAAILIVLMLLAQVFMPWLVLAMASGFANDGRFAMTVDFTRITFIYILFISIAALLSGVLNSLGRFAVAAAAPVLLNLILIGAMGLAYVGGGDIGRALVWSVPIAGIAQMALLWFAAARAGMRLRLKIPHMTPELKRLAIIAAPAALAGGVVQVNLLVGRNVASYFDGAVAWLNYADRLYQLPLGVVGIAIGVVLLPDLSRRLRSNDTEGSRQSLNRATEFTLLLTIPSTVALVVIAQPLVSVLFERGAFSAVDAAATAQALQIYGFGLPAFVLIKVLSPVFFAREDTRTPFHYALISMVVNVALAIGLSVLAVKMASTSGFLAAAVGTSIAAWVMLVLLWRGSRKFGQAVQMDERLRYVLPRISGASVVMGAMIWLAARGVENWLIMPGWRYGALGAVIIIGVISYGASVLLSGAITPADLRRYIRRT